VFLIPVPILIWIPIWNLILIQILLTMSMRRNKDTCAHEESGKCGRLAPAP
jgi:hypothetical protein